MIDQRFMQSLADDLKGPMLDEETTPEMVLAAGPARTDAPQAFVGTRLNVPKAGQAQPTTQDRERLAVGLLDSLAGALRGAAAQTLGLPGDIRSIVDMINQEGAEKYLGQRSFATTEEILQDTSVRIPGTTTDVPFPPVLGANVPRREERQPSVETAQEVGTFLPAPGIPEAVVRGGKMIGRAVQATKDMPVGMSTQIISAEEANKLIEKTLPIDKVQRSKNYKAWAGNADIKDDAGKPMVLYHGTTHDFDTFTLERANPDNHFGEGFYFTDKAEDANINYAGVGPDLKNRISRQADEIQNHYESLDETEAKEFLNNSGVNIDLWTDGGKIPFDDLSWQDKGEIFESIARKELVGNQGTVMPVFAKMNNPVKVGTKDETVFSIDAKWDEDTGDLIEESGNGIDLINAINRMADEVYVSKDEINNAISELSDALLDGVTAGEVDRILRSNISEVEYVGGKFSGPGQFIADVFKQMGFDGIIMDAQKYFGGVMGEGMKGVKNAKHYIVFEPTQVKSAIGNRGTFNPKDPSIVRGVAVGGGGGAVATQEENQ